MAGPDCNSAPAVTATGAEDTMSRQGAVAGHYRKGVAVAAFEENGPARGRLFGAGCSGKPETEEYGVSGRQRDEK